MKAYSKERRQEILADVDAGLGTRAIALKYSCSESWVRRVKQEFREQGKTGPATTRKRIPLWAVHAEAIQRIVADEPDITLRELKEQLGTHLTIQTLCRALQVMKLTLKKNS